MSEEQVNTEGQLDTSRALTPKEKIKNFKDNNPKAFAAFLIAVFLVILMILFSGGDDNADYNPYAQDAGPSNSANLDEAQSMSDDPMDMGDIMSLADSETEAFDEPLPLEKETMIHIAEPRAPVDIMDDMEPLPPKPAKTSKPEYSSSHNTPSLEQLSTAYQPRTMSNDAKINNLLTELDNLVYTTLSQFDLSKIRADALKGTSTQQEVLNQIGQLMDTATMLQKKRSALIDATNDVNNSKLNPKAVIKQQLAPVQAAIRDIKIKIGEFSRNMDDLAIKIKEKPKQQSMLYNGFNNMAQPPKVSSIPALTMLMVDDGFSAQFTVDGVTIEASSIGQAVGDMKIIKVYNDGVLLAAKNNERYIATLDETVKVEANK